MVLTGMCSGCGNEHIRPWGGYCKYLKRAIEKCKELNLKEDEFLLHIDFDTMNADNEQAKQDSKAGVNTGTLDAEEHDVKVPRKVDTLVDPAMVQKLVDITLQQRTQIDDLIHQFKSLSTYKLGQSNVSATAPTVVHGFPPRHPTPASGHLWASHSTLSESHDRPNRPISSSDHQPASSGTIYTPVTHGVTSGDLSNTVPSHPASDLVMGPLTAALSKLSDVIDPSTAIKSKGIFLRPEFYVQHKSNGVAICNLDHSKLTYRELCYGMDCVLVHLLKSGGDAASYASHKLFVSSQAKSNRFIDRALVDYDRHVVDKVIEGESSTFVTGDLLGVALCFHGGNTLPRQQEPRTSRVKKNRRQRDESDGGVPEDFPEHICYGFNYGKCTGACSKQHICRICKAKHKAVGCADRKSDKKE